jgi:hypothetical protein
MMARREVPPPAGPPDRDRIADCPVGKQLLVTHAANVEHLGKEVQRAIRRLRRALKACEGCELRSICPFQQELDRTLERVVHEISQSWKFGK